MKSKPVALKQGKAVSKLVNSHVDNGDGCSHYQLQPGYNLDLMMVSDFEDEDDLHYI